MLSTLRLKNYRCFQETQVSFKELSIIVGKNNAGKSTLIESLRILSLVASKISKLNYEYPPKWLALPETVMGISPSIEGIEISTRGIFYMYGNAPAVIEGEFHCGSRINIYIGEDAAIFATIFDPASRNVESRKFASSLKLDEIKILPQISSLKKFETILKQETVQKNLDTYLSSRNFRNQLFYYKEKFERFKDFAEKSWPGLLIHNQGDGIRTQGDLFLYVKDNGFESEIAFMGHGLQMWLQTMWFLSRTTSSNTIILDEPDVYMHADLQRRLIRLVRNKYKQIIVATHSIEIMSEVDPENILPIDNAVSKQKYAYSVPIVQKIVDEIGSVHNIEIARIFSYKKLLIVEGDKDDVKMLTIFQNAVFPESFEPFDSLPKTFVEGWGAWQRVIGATKVFADINAKITTYCILDSDYHLDSEKNERISEAKRFSLNLHIWKKKEIENYLLVPTALLRHIKKKKKKGTVDIEIVTTMISRFCEEFKEEIIDDYATEIKKKNPSYELKTCNKNARDYINNSWNTRMYDFVPGKKMLAKICFWMTESYGFSTNKFAIAREIKTNEVSEEMKHVIEAIENAKNFTYSEYPSTSFSSQETLTEIALQ